MVDLKKVNKRMHHTSTSLSSNPNSYQTNELKKLEVGERGGNVLLQLLPQLVSPENNQKWNPEDNLGGRRNEVNETSLEVINCVPPAVHCCSPHHRRHPLLANSGLLDDLRLHRLFVGGVVSNIVYRFTSDAAQASLYGVQ